MKDVIELLANPEIWKSPFGVLIVILLMIVLGFIMRYDLGSEKTQEAINGNLAATQSARELLNRLLNITEKRFDSIEEIIHEMHKDIIRGR